jgi:2-polyprenyl-3-methyl-5-hydroxy-6-metoxy-1,4-benzoquinol methylase
MNELDVWGMKIPGDLLSSREATYFGKLPSALPQVEWIWQEMDRVWSGLGLDNKQPLDDQPIGDFYGHPIWLVNGIFTHIDPESRVHRSAIASGISKLGVKRIADYAGGFGELALKIATANPAADVTLIEPYPTTVGLALLERHAGVQVESALAHDYDAIVAQDILEHVEDPVALAYQFACATDHGGVIIFANCFVPVIQCHLPCTFHLRYSFPLVMRAMGLTYVGTVEGAPHAQVFRRERNVSLKAARRVESLSKVFGPPWNWVRPKLKSLKSSLMRT